MNPLKTPKNSYTDFYDIARFSLAWKINVILSFTLLVIAIFFFFDDKTTFTLYLSGFIITSTGVVYLIETKKFITVSYFITFSALILVLFSLFFVHNGTHYIEPLWLVIITIFAYFNLGKKIGHIVLFLVAASVSIFFLLSLNKSGTVKTELSNYQLIGLAIEFSLCMFVIGYFIHNFIKTTAHAEQKFREANVALNEQNKMIQLQNTEKTVLLQEIHHRVKNNLQVITSLLRLQSSEIDSLETKSQFGDAINRVMTMSLIHQKLYQEKNLSQIDTTDYFKTLMEDLVSSSTINIPVEIKVISKLERVGLKTIVPLALLVSELVSNSLKHAFSESGHITLAFSQESNGYFNLKYEDNGTWKQPGNGSAFGLQLIQTLSEQLDGNYTRNATETGTYYEFMLANLDE